MRTFRVIEGDALETLKAMPNASIDACVTDPPYELNFMGKGWDNAGVSFQPETWRAVYDSLKDGSRLLAFGGTRTYHRIACAIEDAGFTIEDCVMWIYGQGFPKHKSKLKPAYEPIVVARKGGASHLNIDACRIEANVEEMRGRSGVAAESNQIYGKGVRNPTDEIWEPSPSGRWPANVILDEIAAQELDRMSGTMRARGNVTPTRRDGGSWFGAEGEPGAIDSGDSGGASRFFYCPKADREERNAGLYGMPMGEPPRTARSKPAEGRQHALGRPRENHHPTVKPISLMCWLVRLVTPEGGTVLDPFTGSGSTGIAALREGFNFVGIERESEYVEIARRRISGDAPLLNTEVAA